MFRGTVLVKKSSIFCKGLDFHAVFTKYINCRTKHTACTYKNNELKDRLYGAFYNNYNTNNNQGIQTDRKILENRPDIIIKNMKDKICLLTNVAIPSDRNVIYKEYEKKLKYTNLSIEIQRM
jgi:hypothetical protein